MNIRVELQIKRTFDIIFCVVMFILFLPIMICIGMMIIITMGRPAIFRQQRPGKNCKIFYIYKFRTMSSHKAAEMFGDGDSSRITRFGHVLRQYSLDELPELWNVLKGEMSLVGPRPLLFEYLDRYSPEQARRHEVRPGITGWAQVNGRNAISWEERFDYDVWYIDNWRLSLDLKILIKTLIKVVKKEGINQRTMITMEKFYGSGGRHGG